MDSEILFLRFNVTAFLHKISIDNNQYIVLYLIGILSLSSPRWVQRLSQPAAVKWIHLPGLGHVILRIMFSRKCGSFAPDLVNNRSELVLLFLLKNPLIIVESEKLIQYNQLYIIQNVLVPEGITSCIYFDKKGSCAVSEYQEGRCG